MSKTTYDEPKSAKGPLYYAYKVFQYVFLLILAAISVMPFIIMIVNSTRNTSQIESHAVSLIPSHYLLQNFKILGCLTVIGKFPDPLLIQHEGDGHGRVCEFTSDPGKGVGSGGAYLAGALLFKILLQQLSAVDDGSGTV